jgi:integrase
VLLKIVRIIFVAAESDGVILRSEAKHVKRLKVQNEQSARRAFTLPELKTILAHCDDEWRSLVLFGFYTGQRLGDLAALTWQNLDLYQKELRLVTGKTGRQIVIPLATPLLQHIEQLPAGDDPKQPVHPRAFDLVMLHGRAGMLSNQFGDILADAGMVEARSHKVENGKGKGRATRRAVSEISFHSLRHTNVSLLKNAGVSDAVAQDLVGHESAEVSRLYTHIEDKAKREAVNKLPVIGEGRAAARTQKR